MPRYEFYCPSCKKLFTQALSLSEFEEGKVKCPNCGARKLEQKLSSFYPVTTKKSA
jgi:putative FmdB family regulatory protein